MYQYPEHLTGEVANLPQTCGVYFFHGENCAHPLYIGKSVNIRRRVQSHLRNPREARLLSATRRITFIETVGEIGALLLESSLVKQQNPLYNKRLRKIRRLCALQVNDTYTVTRWTSRERRTCTACFYGVRRPSTFYSRLPIGNGSA
jgi:excinuclease Cho